MRDGMSWRTVSLPPRHVAVSTRSAAGDARIHAVLRRLGRIVRANRVSLAEIGRKPGTGEFCLCIRHEWAAGVAEPRSMGRYLSCRDLPPGWEELLRAGQPVRGSSTPVLLVPIFCGLDLQSILCVRGRAGRRWWRRIEISILKAAAPALVPAVICPGSCDALHAAEAYYHAIVEDLTDPLCRLLPDGTITYANEAFCTFCRHGRDEVLGMRVQDILPPNIARELPARADMPDAANPTFIREFKVDGTDGVERWYRSICRAIFDDEGTVCGYQAVGHDITERKRQEARNSRINDQKLAFLADAASDAIAVMDNSDRIVYWNSAAEDFFGYTAAEIVGSGVSRIYPPGYPDLPYTRSIRDAIAAAPGGIVRLRFPDALFARKDGSTFPAALSIAAVQTGGEWSRVAIVHDTSAQKAREQALHGETERTATLLRIAGRLNGSVALDAVLDTLCEETARALRVPVAVVFLHKSESDLLVPARSFGMPEEARESLPFIPRAIYEREVDRAGPVFTVVDTAFLMGDVCWKKIPEKPAPMLLSASILHESSLIGALEVATFDSPRRFSPEEFALLKGIADQAALAIVNARLFGERIAYERRLQASLEEKTALLKEVHHRVKNNMQMISSLLSLQGRLIENDAVRERIRESENRVRSLALVHEGLYRSESIAAVDIGAYTRRLADDLIRSYGLEDYIRISVEAAEPVTISGDVAIPLGLILNELISNSLKHGFAGRERGAIAISIARRSDRGLAIECRDDGVGILPDVIDRPPATLGLQLVRVLVAQLGGTIAFRQGEPGAVVEIVVPTDATDGIRRKHA